MKRLFSAYVIVDWSAASKPTTGADSIWIGVMKRDVRFRLAFEAFNVPTRAEAEKKLAAILDDFKKRGERPAGRGPHRRCRPAPRSPSRRPAAP